MSQPSSEYQTELELKTKSYLELIRRIDAILADPVKTLLRTTDEYIRRAEDTDSEPNGFPVWMSDYIQPEPGDDLFSKTVCFGTVQEIGKLRRRFSWLSDSDSELLQRLLVPEKRPANRLIGNLLPKNEDDFFECVKSLSSRTFGALNPFTAAQVFQVLLRDSERQAHGALGFLAFFAMIWPLKRRFPDPQRFGAAIEPWEPKAFVTAKCILPIKALQGICIERATLMREIVGILKRLKEGAEREKYDPHQRWLFNVELDNLRTRLWRLSRVVVAREKLRHHSQLIAQFSDGLSQSVGSHLVTVEDLENPAAITIKLRDSTDPLSTYIKGQFSDSTQWQLTNSDASVVPEENLISAVVHELNSLADGPCLHDNERFRHVELDEEVKSFIKQKPQGHARIQLNWLLLRAAYPEELAMSKSLATSYKNILEGAARAIRDIGEGGVSVFKKADDLLAAIRKELVERLQPDPHSGEPKKDDLIFLEKKGFKFAREYAEHPNKDVRKGYFDDVHDAAQQSLEFCNSALQTLNASYGHCAEVASDLDSIKRIASELAEANEEVAERMDWLVKDATVWCRTVADREIAHASAQNLTDFDPSELVSAIAVAVKWNQMTTTLQVSDAVDKALAGMRVDGSWSSGQPFFSPNNAVGVWAITSDIVLSLTEALQEHRDVDVADTALVRYVDWLERTRTELSFPLLAGQPKQKTGPLAVGWASDRFRHRRKIHFPTTAFSINALLNIRDLMEYRLWQLCERRFTVIRSSEGHDLKKVAPVDLGAQHLSRLHRRLGWMAEKQISEYKHAEYSLVLHGPPGSSKTFIAKALSVEQWKARQWGPKEVPRLVRITPADFTRMGEDRLDSEARLIFDLITGVRGVTILFDEIDDLLRQRNTQTGPLASKPTFMELVVPAMLNRLADLREACPRQELCVLLATNFVESIEPALMRKGRIDGPIAVVYPDQESRLALIIKLMSELGDGLKRSLELNDVEVARFIDFYSNRFAADVGGWPYLTIDSACRTIVHNLKNALEKLRTGKGKGLSLTTKRRQFSREIRDSALQVLAEYSSSLSTPRYEERLGSPPRPELLDEYAHFFIAGRADGEDLEKWVIKQVIEPIELVRQSKKKLSRRQRQEALNKQALCGKIRLILDNENRWTQDRRLREKLAEAAAQALP